MRQPWAIPTPCARWWKSCAGESSATRNCNAAGVPLNPAQLVRDLARRLLGSDAELSVRNFDNCGWDQGELAWVNKTWP